MNLDAFRALPIETQVFVAVILIICIFLHVRFTAKAVGNGPTILTTIGIFATFYGIALGLAKFDSSNIQNSIPELLNGLKTAFWASVVGVGCALTIKFRDHLFGHTPDPLASAGHDDVGPAEIVLGLSRLEHALVGGEEGSLISQLKFLRTETRDELRQLRDAQTKALEKLSEMGSKALIEALKDVIRDFNNNLTEQFGENFKELNIAVGKLVEWQRDYRQQVEVTTERLREIQQLLLKASADYAMVLDRSSEFSRLATLIGQTLQEMSVRQEELQKQSRALAELLLQASGSLPEVEKKIVELARQLSDGISENQKILNTALSNHIKSIDDGVRLTGEGIKRNSEEAARTILQVAANTNDHLTSLAKDFTVAISNAHQGAAQSITESAESLRQSMRSTIEAMSAANSEHNKQLGELASKTKDNVALLDKALGEELERSLTSLGSQLTALSQKFVSDYLPLTDSLRRVVEISKRTGMQ